MINDILNNTEHFGIVVDSDDPERLGRCKIKVWNLYDNLKDEDLPWAFCNNSVQFAGGESGGFGQISIPKKNTIVKVHFNNNDIHSPQWSSILHINEDVRKALNDSYLNSHIVTWDQDEGLKVWYTPSNGFQIFLKDSSISINPDQSILIDHRDSLSNIELKEGKITINASSKVEVNTPFAHINGKVTHLGSNPIFSEVMGEPLMTILDALSLIIDAKWPPSPGVATVIAQNARVALSNTVKNSP